MATRVPFKNINMMTKEQYAGLGTLSNDSLYAISSSGFGKPSGRYIDLSLGASATTYTAPADGWFFVEKNTTAAGQRLIFTTANMEQESIAHTSGNWVGGFVPVKKGGTCQISYTAGGATRLFRFIYDEGE